MSVINIDVSRPCAHEIPIGWVGEHEVTAVIFDLSTWVGRYGYGSVALAVERRTDAHPYIVPVNLDDDKITWTISNTDTAIVGRGRIQISYYVNSKVKKSAIYHINVMRSLPSDGPAPQPYETWLETLQEMTAQTTANAQSASQSAQSASQSAQSAGASAQSAASDAQTASTAAASASTSEANAEHYAELAEQSASRAGYALFDVDDQTGELIVTVTDTVDEAMTFIINEETGELEVTLV